MPAAVVSAWRPACPPTPLLSFIQPHFLCERALDSRVYGRFFPIPAHPPQAWEEPRGCWGFPPRGAWGGRRSLGPRERLGEAGTGLGQSFVHAIHNQVLSWSLVLVGLVCYSQETEDKQKCKASSYTRS